MKIHVVCRDDGWALGRTAMSWVSNWPEATHGPTPDLSADANVYCNYAYLTKKTPTFDVAWFTHRRRDKTWQEMFDNAGRLADLCLAQSTETARWLPIEKTRLIRPGTDMQFFSDRPVRFLVAAKRAEDNRKRNDLINVLQMIPGIEIRFTNGAVPWKEMPRLYEWADYLLVLSELEGGPMTVHEALAMKKPVIAPNVGLCWDWPVIRYDKFDDLKVIVEKLGQAANPDLESCPAWADAIYATIEGAIAEHAR